MSKKIRRTYILQVDGREDNMPEYVKGYKSTDWETVQLEWILTPNKDEAQQFYFHDLYDRNSKGLGMKFTISFGGSGKLVRII